MSWPLRVIRWSYVALFVLVPLIVLPWTSELFEFNKIILTWALTAVIACAWAVRCIRDSQRIFIRTPLDLPLVLFLLANFISLTQSLDLRTSLFGYYGRWNGGLLSLISYALLYWAAVSNLDHKFIPKLFNWLLVTAGTVSIYGIAQHYGLDAQLWVQDVQNRVFSSLGQPNWLAAWLVALIFIPISRVLSSKNWSTVQLLNCATAAVLFVTLLFTKSRSGFLAFGISSLIFWAFQFVQHKSTIINHFLIFSLLTLTLTLTISNPILDLLLKPTTDNRQPTTTNAGPALETGGTESGTIRKIVWTGALRIWQASPKNLLLGTGPETFAMAYYQYRPIEHNNTSEWELLYNKAHNEFLNIVSNTGLLGLVSYFVLLIAMAITLIKNTTPYPPPKLGGGIKEGGITIALFSGWISLSVTNFWGFSVVPTQLLLFLLPAFAISLSNSPHLPASSTKNSPQQKLFIIICLLAFSTSLFSLTKYWLADFHFSSSQKDLRAFSAIEDPGYLVTAYQSAVQASNLAPTEPVILTQLAESAAYLAIITSDVDAASSAQAVELANAAATSAISLSPAHPSHYKAASRVFILLSALDPKYLDLADSVLATAQSLSPTDPRLPYQRAVIAKYQKDYARTNQFLAAALILKPDFNDAKSQLDQVATPPSSGSP